MSKVKGAGGAELRLMTDMISRRHARRLKICMWVAEGILRTGIKTFFVKKSRGRARGPKPPK